MKILIADDSQVMRQIVQRTVWQVHLPHSCTSTQRRSWWLHRPSPGVGLPTARGMARSEAVRRRARALHRAIRPTLVTVDAALDDEAADRARNVTDALAAAWAVVAPCVNPADLAAHLDRLGHLDAIAVRGARRTGDPGTVSGPGYLVGRW